MDFIDSTGATVTGALPPEYLSLAGFDVGGVEGTFRETRFGDVGTEFSFVVSELRKLTTEIFGDYNDNGIVDAPDYGIWRNSVGATNGLAADGNGNGLVDLPDYVIWRDNFGQALSWPSIVPEPTTWMLAVTALCLIFARRRTSRSKTHAATPHLFPSRPRGGEGLGVANAKHGFFQSGAP